MNDPISRLEFCRSEVDRVFGRNYAADHPDVVVAVMQSAASDYAALAISRSLQEIAVALTDDGPTDHLADIVRKSAGIIR
jgi:hypothetical protein